MSYHLHKDLFVIYKLSKPKNRLEQSAAMNLTSSLKHQQPELSTNRVAQASLSPPLLQPAGPLAPHSVTEHPQG